MAQASGDDSSRKFRLNPLEAAVFAAVFGVFGLSVYRLFDDGADSAVAALSLHPTAQRMQQERVAAVAATSATDDASRSFEASIASLKIDCQDSKSLETSADRVRLDGSFCQGQGRGPASANSQDGGDDRFEGAHTVIVNRANAFTATLFEAPSPGHFLTDFIPLEPGENRLVFDFHLKSGKTVSFERTIVRK